MRRLRPLLIASTALLFGSGVASAQTRVTLSTGVDFSTGDYGRDMDTEVISVPMSLRVSHDRWSVRVSVPWLSVSGPADLVDVTVGEGGVIEEGSPAGTTRVGTVTGFGDTTVSVTRSFREVFTRTGYLDVTARARLPTGEEDRGLGIGVIDYSLATEYGLSTRQGGAYIGVGRRFLGQPEGLRRMDGWQGNIGVWRYFGSRTTLGVDGYWREASFEFGEDPAEVGAYIAYRIDDQWRVTGSINTGLSDASPDTNIGMRVSWRSKTVREAETAR